MAAKTSAIAFRLLGWVGASMAGSRCPHSPGQAGSTETTRTPRRSSNSAAIEVSPNPVPSRRASGRGGCPVELARHQSGPCPTRARCWPVLPRWTSTLCAPPLPRHPRTPTTLLSGGAFAPCKPLPSLRLMLRTTSKTSHRLPPSRPSYTPSWAGHARARPMGCPFTSPTTWTWSTGPAGRCATTSAGPSPRICRRSWSGSASPERHGWSWPRTSRPPSAAGTQAGALGLPLLVAPKRCPPQEMPVRFIFLVIEIDHHIGGHRSLQAFKTHSR